MTRVRSRATRFSSVLACALDPLYSPVPPRRVCFGPSILYDALPRSGASSSTQRRSQDPTAFGELGSEAHRFVDVLADAGISIWQVLPLSPTGYGDSPYQTFSAFAGNPLLISVEDDGRVFPRHTVEFDTVIPHKRGLLERAIAQFKPDVHFRDFAEAKAWWLDDYALFMALKDAHGGAAWTTVGARRRVS
jgi:4-alpha-glucanotransferase